VSDLTWTVGSALSSALQVIGIALLLGALGTAWLLRGADARDASRRIRRIAISGAFALMAAATARAVLQAAALAESPSAFATMLHPVMFETELGMALRVQAAAALLALVAWIMMARTVRVGLALALPASAVLSLAPGLGGHPAAHEQPALALTGAFLHVAGVGIWLGTLTVLVATARLVEDITLARAVQRFHRLAAAGLALVVATGATKLFDVRPPLSELLSSTWGLALVIKLSAFVLVGLLGWWHWRRADAALAVGRRGEVLRSFSTELVLAGVVLAASAVLINSMPPERAEVAGPPANPDAVATRLYGEIASPYCPGMSLTSCPSDGAFRLKRRIRARLDSVSADSVMVELRAEFGPEIDGKTPATGFGLVAWLAPFAALVVGAVGILAWTRRSTQRAQAVATVPAHATHTTDTAGRAAPADAAELARLTQALRADD
jgi:putative copper export protein